MADLIDSYLFCSSRTLAYESRSQVHENNPNFQYISCTCGAFSTSGITILNISRREKLLTLIKCSVKVIILKISTKFFGGEVSLTLSYRSMKHKLDILFFLDCAQDFKWFEARQTRNGQVVGRLDYVGLCYYDG